MKVLILWSRVSGYMSACWRRLAEYEDVTLRIVAWQTSGEFDASTFDESIVDGLNCRPLTFKERDRDDIVIREIEEFCPDVVIASGWVSHAYRKAILSLPTQRPATIMAIDTPLKGLRHSLYVRARQAAYLRKIDAVIVAGERSWQFARRLGFAERSLFRGVYGWDETCHTGDIKVGASRSFVYVGRLAEEKGVRTLIDAYLRYRASRQDPWGLIVCGGGPLKPLLDEQPVDFRGFVQPSDLPVVLSEADVFVLPSHFEPWGVALAEAMGAGLPAIATEACGAGIDLVRSQWNGIVVPTQRVPELADALTWFHENAHSVPQMGRNATKAAEPFNSENWAIRWREIIRSVVARRAC